MDRASMTVGRAESGELDALLAIDVLLVSRERQDAILRESVASGGALVARDASALAGYLTWDLGFFHRPFVRLLVVAPAYQRRGIGRALVAAAEHAAAPHGELFITTETINAPMRALLLAEGYEPCGSIDHINGPGNAELVFYKRLVDSAAPNARASSAVHGTAIS